MWADPHAAKAVIGVVPAEARLFERLSGAIHNPSVLFLDEPLEGMDPVSADVIRRLLTSSSGRRHSACPPSTVAEARIAARVLGRAQPRTNLADGGHPPFWSAEAFATAII